MVMDGKFTLGSWVVGIIYKLIYNGFWPAPFLKMNLIGLVGVRKKVKWRQQSKWWDRDCKTCIHLYAPKLKLTERFPPKHVWILALELFRTWWVEIFPKTGSGCFSWILWKIDGCFRKREYLKIVRKYKGSVQWFHSVFDLEVQISWCVFCWYILYILVYICLVCFGILNHLWKLPDKGWHLFDSSFSKMPSSAWFGGFRL